MSEQDTRAKRRRREHSPALKRELIKQSLQPGASVSGIALDSGINANLLFKWRREHLRANGRALISTAASAQPVLLPVKIESPIPQVVAAPAVPPPPPTSRGKVGSIEIDMGGARVILRGTVDPSSVRAVLQALRGLE